jgi:predicted transcriptional regulator
MAIAISEQRVGPLLRQWRERRRLSQLELALEAGVSARHLSFVETGRSKPGRDMLLRVFGHGRGDDFVHRRQPGRRAAVARL